MRICHLLLHVWRQIAELAACLHGCYLRWIEPALMARLSHLAVCHLLSLHHLPLPHHSPLLLVHLRHHLRRHTLLLHVGMVHHLSALRHEMLQRVRIGSSLWHTHSRLHTHHGRLRNVLALRARYSRMHGHLTAQRLRVWHVHGLARVHIWMLRHSSLRREGARHHDDMRGRSERQTTFGPLLFLLWRGARSQQQPR